MRVNATKKTVDGITFDSTKEAKRYLVLKEAQDKGEISDLKRQVRFELYPMRKGETLGEKWTERKSEYIADFTYYKDGQYVVEDVKGYRKGAIYNVFVQKRKRMLDRYGIHVIETQEARNDRRNRIYK